MTGSHNVITQLQYLKNSRLWDIVKPYQIVRTPQPGLRNNNLEFEQFEIEVADVRSLCERPRIDQWGFEWIEGKCDETLEDVESINRHIGFLEEIVLAKLGAEKVFTIQQQVSVLGMVVMIQNKC